jgi:hypothetical protein
LGLADLDATVLTSADAALTVEGQRALFRLFEVEIREEALVLRRHPFYVVERRHRMERCSSRATPKMLEPPFALLGVLRGSRRLSWQAGPEWAVSGLSA